VVVQANVEGGRSNCVGFGDAAQARQVVMAVPSSFLLGSFLPFEYFSPLLAPVIEDTTGTNDSDPHYQ
jgi:hypothetical protein